MDHLAAWAALEIQRVDVNAVTDNAAVLQQRVTKGTNPFLSTLAEPGRRSS
eukprot:jgi/Ulvmu1/9309/UM050_0058.1